jgi:hypothetical protein
MACTFVSFNELTVDIHLMGCTTTSYLAKSICGVHQENDADVKSMSSGRTPKDKNVSEANCLIRFSINRVIFAMESVKIIGESS